MGDFSFVYPVARGSAPLCVAVLSGLLLGERLTVLRVEDDGPGIPPRLREAALIHGVRTDEMQPGGGLGLSIVAEFIEDYGGEIDLGDSELGGLLVVVRLAS